MVAIFSLAVLFSNEVNAMENSQVEEFLPVNASVSGGYDLRFNYQGVLKSVTFENRQIKFRAYENIVYVRNPKNAQYQSMNIYVPEDYFQSKSINGYTSRTAPIFMPTGVGGYMPSLPQTPYKTEKFSMGADTILQALERGYVVASPAIRGRTTVSDSNSNVYVGKAPAFVVDFKAAVRYLRLNQDRLPAGDTEKIISNGTSAGGALSALLGATGNAREFQPYLDEIGAANARDDIFASSDYCPITNLEHADSAYEWIFHDVLESHQSNRRMPPQDLETNRPENAPVESKTVTPLTETEMRVSTVLRNEFIPYLNSLQLKDPATGEDLWLDYDGHGTFEDFVKSKYIESAQYGLDNNIKDSENRSVTDLDWVAVIGDKVVDVDLKKYAVYATRMKSPPAFDKLDLSSGENDEFADENNTPKHFTFTSRVFETKQGAIADENVIHLMNPMHFIGRSDVNVAKHYRIRHGAIDRDTSLAIPAILAVKLANNGIDVDFYSPWNTGHAGDYDLPQLFDWIDSLCK